MACPYTDLMPIPPPDKPLMRSLGEFVGHLWKAVRTDPGPERERQVLRSEVEEDRRETDKGPIVVRRTTIEEIEFIRSKQGE